MPDMFKESEMETLLQHLDLSHKQINTFLTRRYHVTFLEPKNWGQEYGSLDYPLSGYHVDTPITIKAEAIP